MESIQKLVGFDRNWNLYAENFRGRTRCCLWATFLHSIWTVNEVIIGGFIDWLYFCLEPHKTFFWELRARERNQTSNRSTSFSSVSLKPQDDSRRISNEEQMKRQELSTKFHNTIKVVYSFLLTSSRLFLTCLPSGFSCLMRISCQESMRQFNLSMNWVWIEFALYVEQ